MISIMFASCSTDEDNNPTGIDYRQEMREFVIEISKSAKSNNPKFFIIPQNGVELVTHNGEEDGQAHSNYLNAIDANGQEDLFYGYVNDDEPTAKDENNYLKSYLNISKNNGNKILVTDYCYTQANIDASYIKNGADGYVSFAANHRELDNIPTYQGSINQENDNQILNFSQVENFLYLINPQWYSSKLEFINAITSTNYDLVIMDLFFHDGIMFTSAEINQLKSKSNKGSRLIICYMSIGEAEDYRYYWNRDWNTNRPDWMDRENPDWAGNFKVKYWDKGWQNIIYGNNSSYLNMILNAGFDGVYLDIIDAFEYYE